MPKFRRRSWTSSQRSQPLQKPPLRKLSVPFPPAAEVKKVVSTEAMATPSSQTEQSDSAGSPYTSRRGESREPDGNTSQRSAADESETRYVVGGGMVGCWLVGTGSVARVPEECDTLSTGRMQLCHVTAARLGHVQCNLGWEAVALNS